MNINEAIDFLDEQVPDSTKGLPLDVFLFASRLLPLVNVDLLVKDERGRTLLAWRDDPYAGTGWHVPGGILRFRERLETRVQKVAETEIGTEVRVDPNPIAVNQFMHPSRKTRGHFISFLYRCFVSKDFIPANTGLKNTDAGYLMWHEKCPPNLICVHEIYKSHI
ncbi:MAG: NUDIX domain-containing protein [Thermoguttaceae bacterium]